MTVYCERHYVFYGIAIYIYICVCVCVSGGSVGIATELRAARSGMESR